MPCDHYERALSLVVQYSCHRVGWCVFEQAGTIGYCRSEPQATKEEADVLCRRWQAEAQSGLVPGYHLLALTS